MAMSYLRSRKQLEDLLSKRLRSLETVQATLVQVESAAGDIEVRYDLSSVTLHTEHFQIMKAYETSTMTLKNLLAHLTLNRVNIDETMEAMAEAAADHAEIDEAIKFGGKGVATASGDTIDEEDLQKELE
jgi:charged multivesicular body protein 7